MFFFICGGLFAYKLVFPGMFRFFIAQTEASGVAGGSAEASVWLALRATLIVMPAYLLALTNPSQYLMTIMKSVSLGQQASMVDARHAGRGRCDGGGAVEAPVH